MEQQALALDDWHTENCPVFRTDGVNVGCGISNPKERTATHCKNCPVPHRMLHQGQVQATLDVKINNCKNYVLGNQSCMNCTGKNGKSCHSNSKKSFEERKKKRLSKRKGRIFNQKVALHDLQKQHEKATGDQLGSKGSNI